MDAMNTSTASQEDREYDAVRIWQNTTSAKPQLYRSKHAAVGRARGSKENIGSVPNLQNLLPVQLTTQLSVAMAAHAHTEDPGPFPSRHPGCRVRVHALGCYLVLCQ